MTPFADEQRRSSTDLPRHDRTMPTPGATHDRRRDGDQPRAAGCSSAGILPKVIPWVNVVALATGVAHMALVVADAVTGLTLDSGREVVAVLLAERRNGYPYVRDAAHAPLRATALFEPVSLPVRGRVGDSGRFRPDPGQVSEELALAMTGSSSWRELEDGALAKGCRIDGGQGSWPDDAAPVDQVLGVAFFDHVTWSALHRHRGRDRVRDIDETIYAWRKADATEVTTRLVDGGSLLDLVEVAWDYVGEDGKSRRLPPLAGCLAYQEGGRTFGSDFANWFSRRSGVMGRMGRPEVATPVLSGLWEVGEAVHGLRALGRVLSPSPALSDVPNHSSVAVLALGTLDIATRMLADRAENEDAWALNDLVALSERLDDLKAQVDAAVAKVRSDLGLGM